MPTVTTELEIFDCLSQNLRKSAENCQKLAWDPKRGHIYNDFRKSLKLVEGCCRQILPRTSPPIPTSSAASM